MKHSLKTARHIYIGWSNHKHGVSHRAQRFEALDRSVGTRLNPHHRRVALSCGIYIGDAEHRIGAFHCFILRSWHYVAVAIGSRDAIGSVIEVGAKVALNVIRKARSHSHRQAFSANVLIHGAR